MIRTSFNKKVTGNFEIDSEDAEALYQFLFSSKDDCLDINYQKFRTQPIPNQFLKFLEDLLNIQE